jgi:MSHA biogenesis protein MshM
VIYLAHYGLREPPFGITPDTSFFFACRGVQEALNMLLVAVANGEGFIKITGEVGTGKTLLCRKFLSTLDSTSWVTAYLPNPNLEPRTLLLELAEELGLKIDVKAEQHHILKAINLTLLNHARNRKRVVVCLDEAQAMPTESLETLRLLTNLETEKRKLLQVVLFGQPELDTRLANPAVRQLRQRITFQHRMGPLTPEETGHYLQHRLAVAGYRGDRIFTPRAVRAIVHASRGLPRLVNILANKSMMLAYGEGESHVAIHHVRAAIADTPVAASLRAAWLWFALFCLAGTGIGWIVLQ